MSKRTLLLQLSPPIYRKNSHPIGARPSYVLKYIEALLMRDNASTIKYIDQRVRGLTLKDIRQMVDQYSPQYIIMDVSALNYQISVEFLRILKKAENFNTVIIGVGQEVSADIKNFREKNKQFDILFAGEAERKVVSAITKLNDNVPVEAINQFYRENNTENTKWVIDQLDALPNLYYDQEVSNKYSFVYSLKIAKKLRWGHMLTSRGCPHPCIFCSQLMRESYSYKVRLRSAGHVADEMEYLIDQGVNIIAFDDDNFTNSSRHVKDVCNEIIRRKLKVNWIIHARIDEAPDDLLKLMGEAGCILIRFGLESRVERILEILKKTNNVKKWIESGQPTVRRARSYGIGVACLFQVGSPTESLEDVKETIKYAKLLNPDIVQVAYFTPFSGTAAYDMFQKQIEEVSNEDIYHYSSPVINVSAMTDSELKRAQGLFYKKFLLRPSFIVRHVVDNALFYFMNHDVLLKLLRIIKII